MCGGGRLGGGGAPPPPIAIAPFTLGGRAASLLPSSPPSALVPPPAAALPAALARLRHAAAHRRCRCPPARPQALRSLKKTRLELELVGEELAQVCCAVHAALCMPRCAGAPWGQSCFRWGLGTDHQIGCLRAEGCAQVCCGPPTCTTTNQPPQHRRTAPRCRALQLQAAEAQHQGGKQQQQALAAAMAAAAGGSGGGGDPELLLPLPPAPPPRLALHGSVAVLLVAVAWFCQRDFPAIQRKLVLALTFPVRLPAGPAVVGLGVVGGGVFGDVLRC